MVRIEFEAFVKELSAYFERTKAPAQRTMDLWAEDVRHIPNTHLNEILSVAKNLEMWPRNLPAFMRAKSMELKETRGEDNKYAIHPRRLNPKAYAKRDCPKCNGEGLIPWPMDWPMRRDEDGKMVTRKFTPKALCACTDAAEYGF